MGGMDINANSVQAFKLQGNKPPPMPNNVLTRSQRKALTQEKLASAVPDKVKEEEKDFEDDDSEEELML